jgi:hypothetical protein
MAPMHRLGGAYIMIPREVGGLWKLWRVARDAGETDLSWVEWVEWLERYGADDDAGDGADA